MKTIPSILAIWLVLCGVAHAATLTAAGNITNDFEFGGAAATWEIEIKFDPSTEPNQFGLSDTQATYDAITSFFGRVLDIDGASLLTISGDSGAISFNDGPGTDLVRLSDSGGTATLADGTVTSGSFLFRIGLFGGFDTATLSSVELSQLIDVPFETLAGGVPDGNTNFNLGGFVSNSVDGSGGFFGDIQSGSVVSDSGTVDTLPVPLPASMPLMLAGIGGLVVIARRRL